jgi:hypothetical protein
MAKIGIEIIGAVDKIPVELPKEIEIKDVMKGVKAWTNPINKFRVVRLHRSADPKKIGPEWEAQTRAGMNYTDWLREYEIVWQSFKGQPVYLDDWNPAFHVADEKLVYTPSLPIVRGWDFGRNPAVVFAQLMPGMRLFVLGEVVGENIGFENFIPEAHRLSKEWFPECRKFIEVIDPAGVKRNDTDERSCFKIMRDPPYVYRPIVPGVQVPTERRNSVVTFLQRADRGLPCLLVDPRAKTIIGGFNGGYHFAWSRDGSLKDKPEKNNYSHPHDALQYICTRVTRLDMRIGTKATTIPTPSYGFNRVKVPHAA